MAQKTAKEILIDARRTAAIPGNLTNGMLVRVREDGTRCYCALGHIALASDIPVIIHPEYDDTWDRNDKYTFLGLHEDYSPLSDMEPVKALAAVIGQLEPEYQGDYPAGTVYMFNDYYVKTSPETILKAFDKAIAALD